MKNYFDRGGTRRFSLLAVATALLVSGLVWPQRSAACDLCAIYTSVAIQESKPGPWLALSEQFTSFKTLSLDGDEIDNEEGEVLRSSITQVLLGYNLRHDFGLQASIPYVARRFRRLEEGIVVSGHERGLGDVSLLANWLALEKITGDGILRLSFSGGVKLPTGDSDRLGEEAMHEGAASEAQTTVGNAHADGEESGVHGHDLALGTGSLDAVLGTQLFASLGKGFATAELHYTIRTEGDFDYEYANDLGFRVGAGAFLVSCHPDVVAAEFVLSGETKGKDKQHGDRVDDTAITALYLGPRILYSRGDYLVVDMALELPAIQNNTGLQIVADYRLKAGASWHF